MKFAKTLQGQVVSEWQDKYLDYKQGKKKAKAVRQAIKRLPGLRSESATSLQAIQEVDDRRAEFFNFLDQQLDKVNDFYRSEELEASKRAQLLREQLQEIPLLAPATEPSTEPASRPPPRRSIQGWTYPHVRAWAASTWQALRQTPTWIPNERQRDYARKRSPLPRHHKAVKRLKAILQEEYRHLELLRAFSDMNRTAFRKIIKKFIKESGEHENGLHTTYMEDKVNKAYFVVSDGLQASFDDYERLYAKHFTQGNRKVAASKLREKTVDSVDFIAPAGRAGIALGSALVLLILALVCGINDLNGIEPYAGQTTMLLQLYGGYFLILEMATMFVLACVVFNKFRINHGFIFELDRKSALNWYQQAGKFFPQKRNPPESPLHHPHPNYRSRYPNPRDREINEDQNEKIPVAPMKESPLHHHHPGHRSRHPNLGNREIDGDHVDPKKKGPSLHSRRPSYRSRHPNLGDREIDGHHGGMYVRNMLTCE